MFVDVLLCLRTDFMVSFIDETTRKLEQTTTMLCICTPCCCIAQSRSRFIKPQRYKLSAIYSFTRLQLYSLLPTASQALSHGV